MPVKPNLSPAWGDHIQVLIRKLRVSQAGLAGLLGVSPATITRWMKGTHEPTSSSYLALGNLAGAPEGLYFWERAGVDPANLPEANPGVALSSLRVKLKDFRLVAGRHLSREVVANQSSAVLIPLLNLTAYGDRIPPGPHVTLGQAKVEDVLMAPLSWCPHPASMLCMHVDGDSMMPVIAPDAIITVDTAVTDRAQLDKKLTVFSHRDLGFKIARFQRLPSSDLLISANHRLLPVDVSNASKWKVLGEVMWWVSHDKIPAPEENSKSS
jgi:transcriptional regulator with XRE-family HTH domain